MVRTFVAWMSTVLASVVAGCVFGFVVFRPDLAQPYVFLLSGLAFVLLVAVVVGVRRRRKNNLNRQLP